MFIAMALVLTLVELILIYNVQFPVLQQNQDDTWYDAKGNIIFTCSKGLNGVGLVRLNGKKSATKTTPFNVPLKLAPPTPTPSQKANSTKANKSPTTLPSTNATE